jgi:HK97 family phage portal protein
MSRRRAPKPTLLQQARNGLARLTTRTRASTHVKTITDSHELALALAAGVETDAGVNISPDRAMQVATVWACVRIISNAIAMCPLILYGRDGEKEVEATGHRIHYLLKHRPNRWQTPFEFKQLLAFHLLLRGNSYWFKGTVGGVADELFPMHPDQTQLYRWSELEWQYYYTPWRGGFQIFEPHEVMHVRGMSTDGIEGMSPVSAARQAIGGAAAMEKHGNKLFSNGAQVNGVLKMGPGQKLSPEALQRLQDDWKRKYSGLDNAYKVPILEDGMEFTQMSMSSVDSQFIEGRKFSRSEIAMFFGVPPHMLGDVEKTTSWGSGIEQQGIGFVINTLQPWLTNIEDALNASLLNPAEQIGMFCRFDTEPLIRGDFASTVTALKTLRETGIISVNEARKKLRMNPRDDEFGDDYLVPSNMTSQVVGPQTKEPGKLVPNDPQKALPPPQQRRG